MPTDGNAQSGTPPKSQAELDLEEKVRMAELNKRLADAEFEAAKKRKEATALSETTQPTEEDKAKAAKVIAEAERDAIKAQRELFKGPEITSPTGKITTNEGGIFPESRILSHTALSSCLKTFVENFKKAVGNDQSNKPKAATLLIYNPADIPAFELYASIIEQLKSLKPTYGAWSNEADKELARNLQAILVQPNEAPDVPKSEAASLAIDPITLGLAASGVVRTAADLVSLFRTTTDFKNFDLTPDELLVVSILAKAIRADATLSQWKIYNPSVFPINTVNNTGGSASPLLTALNEVKGARQVAEGKKISDRIKEVQAELDKISSRKKLDNKEEERKQRTRDERNRQTLNKYMARLTRLESLLKALNNTHTDLQSILTTSDPATKLSGQTLLLRAERLIKILQTDNTYTIKFTATARGTNRITENLWRNARISHSAGAGFDCLVFAADGSLFYSDSLYEYSPFTASEDIPKKSP